MFQIFLCSIIDLAIVIKRIIEAGLGEKDIPRWKLEDMLARVGQGSKILFLKLKVLRSHSEHGILEVV